MPFSLCFPLLPALRFAFCLRSFVLCFVAFFAAGYQPNRSKQQEQSSAAQGRGRKEGRWPTDEPCLLLPSAMVKCGFHRVDPLGPAPVTRLPAPTQHGRNPVARGRVDGWTTGGNGD
jgi:hypothetical protein